MDWHDDEGCMRRRTEATSEFYNANMLTKALGRQVSYRPLDSHY